MKIKQRPYLIGFWIFLLFKAVAAGLIISYAGIGLGPDEAQYWTWSQRLSYGYYSKPPGIAWQIALGTGLFGNNEWGVRSIGLFLSLLIALATYSLARKAGCSDKTAFWSGLVMLFCPLGWFSSLFAITDTGYILFWTLAAGAAAEALHQKQEFPYFLIGFWIMLGALFKWPIYLFWIFVILFSGFSWKLWGGIALSLAGLLPSLVWNQQNEWSTFRHVSATLFQGAVEQGTNLSLFRGNFLSFLGAQAALLSPVLFLLYLFAAGYLVVRWKKIPAALRFCGVVSASLLAVYLLGSLGKKMQGNWAVFVYPTGIVFLSWVFCERIRRGEIGIAIGIVVSLLLTAFAILLPVIQAKRWIANFRIPFAMNPFKHNLGWDRLGETLRQYPTDFLFADRYQVVSELSFYGPGQQRAYFMNLHGLRKNQFSFWPSLEEEQKGKTGIFVVVENDPHIPSRILDKIGDYTQLLEPYFSRVEVIGIFPLFVSNGEVAKAALLIRGEDFLGKAPQDPEKY